MNLKLQVFQDTQTKKIPEYKLIKYKNIQSIKKYLLKKKIKNCNPIYGSFYEFKNFTKQKL